MLSRNAFWWPRLRRGGSSLACAAKGGIIPTIMRKAFRQLGAFFMGCTLECARWSKEG